MDEFVYVCMCVCVRMYMCVCVCTYVCVCVCVHVYLFCVRVLHALYMSACTHVHGMIVLTTLTFIATHCSMAYQSIL